MAVWVICSAVILVLGAVAWVGSRALMAKSELESAIPLASAVQDQVVAGQSAEAGGSADQLVKHAVRAADLTSDPIWRAFEVIPALGQNLSAVRQLAAVVENIATGAVAPLTEAAGSIDIEAFKPTDGAINVQPMVDAQPSVARAASALSTAQTDISAINSANSIGQVSDAVNQLREVVDGAALSIDSVDRAVRLLPSILGVAGPRDYLVLFQNPAELRSTGGISGAVALLHTDGGQISLAQQVSSAEFKHFDSPVLELPTETRGIYGDITGRFIQDVNLTPDFTQSAKLAQEMWRLQFGQDVAGVLSIDPVALSYLLRATGPITLPTGDVMSSENAVQLLLSDVYARYPDTDDQDAFFASAAGSVFAAVAGGSADPLTLVQALARAGSEHRVLVWSADDTEQSILADTTLAGGLPISSADTERFGLYFNDATGAKMGPFLDVQTAVGQTICRNDRRPNYAVDVILTNTAPADAATALPGYVTAEGNFGVPPGSVKTIVSVYGAPDMDNLGLTRDGVPVGYHPATDSGYPVSGIAIELAPGETTTIRFNWLGGSAAKKTQELQMTPVIHRNETRKLEIAC
ncbi:DUF4012 domain-containing protein [Cryobacterium sp. PAMC25264]|uniref:DUF4012 domain-containing protein n=1 Tax=Cryobacterium sp. PAMC25264 TaxID=2861288 RepID=UPI001C639100|nr:DUF4012 domain-containing protein [Cryobacterium sp. PAMC25264]QYF73740.1 DUF4012 domain-containing protein [Cryobacterium sp. PAMC25264]